MSKLVAYLTGIILALVLGLNLVTAVPVVAAATINVPGDYSYFRNYFPILISDGTASSPHGPVFMQDATISNVKNTFGWVATTENALTTLTT